MKELLKLFTKVMILCLFMVEILFKFSFSEFLVDYDNSQIFKSVLNFNSVIRESVTHSVDTKALVYSLINENEKISNVSTIDVDEIDETKDIYEPIQVQDNLNIAKTSTIKSVYIYSTHQMEEYLDGYYVTDGAKYLASKLEALGIDVDVEGADFVEYGKPLGYGYKQLYSCSRHYIMQALSKKKYDLVIDFHRDALNRELTYITHNNKDYAKVMVVYGTLNEHYETNYKLATALTDKISNTNVPIIKGVYKQYARYNQDLSSRSLLIEIGSQNNYYSEIKNSLDLVAIGIYNLKE